MIDLGIIITGSIGLFSTIVSGWASWFFARKKYDAEVDNTLIQGMHESLEFYKTLSNDNKTRLEEVLQRNNELEKRDELLEQEVRKLKEQMMHMMSTICTDLSCQLRKRNMEETNDYKGKENI